MFSKIKQALGLGGGERAEAGPGAVKADAVEYKGYRIRPEPYKVANGFQTCGVIEKEFPDGRKEHRFIRADTYSSADDAVEFTVTKGKLIVDQDGDRMFK